MKLVKVTCHKIHTSFGKKFKDEEMEMTIEEYKKLQLVRPGTLEILGDVVEKKKPKKAKAAHDQIVTD